MTRYPLTAAVLFAGIALGQAGLAPPAFAAGPNCGDPIRNDSRSGYVCMGRWEQRATGRTKKCEDGTVRRELTYRCTQWQLTGGGTLIDPNNMNPPIRNPRPPGSGPPPAAPPLR